MKLNKVRNVANKLYEIATENEVTIFVGDKKQLDTMSKDFEGMFVFITDGSPSKEKIKSEKTKLSKEDETISKKVTINSIIDVKNEIVKELDDLMIDSDFSDIGNNIGIAIGKYRNKLGYEFDDLISGIEHGISISNGTHK